MKILLGSNQEKNKNIHLGGGKEILQIKRLALKMLLPCTFLNGVKEKDLSLKPLWFRFLLIPTSVS